MHAQAEKQTVASHGAEHALPAFPFGWEHHKDRHCIWIVSPEGYVHSRAFEDVALGLHYAFAELGGSAPLVTNPRDWNGRVPIVYGANLLPSVAAQWLPPESIIVNMEQVSAESSWINHRYLGLLKKFAVLDYSERNRQGLARFGVPAEILDVGYNRHLTRVPQAPVKDIDVLFYGSVNERRKNVLVALQASGLNLVHLFGVYGAERDAFIGRSKIVLNVHHFDAAIFEICRVSFLLANGACVVSEGNIHDPEVAAFAEGMAFCNYDRLVETCIELVRDDERRSAIASRGFGLMCERQQATILSALMARGG
ncbi:hypothetical protein [Rhizobium miluonense]|jgi:hypothetical protein|uniref:Glycosyl transferases group 1 n=1 Tax=Rhizobium miluonense TaxID=411945 RepID=A0ABU1SRQ8_9HYPH|nr:hypothetical protein [Rhizobium miluonense]MDR6901655.1 hypothetical protein [Rhizobium miluonense]